MLRGMSAAGSDPAICPFSSICPKPAGGPDSNVKREMRESFSSSGLSLMLRLGPALPLRL